MSRRKLPLRPPSRPVITRVPIALPSLRQHLHEIARRRETWPILVRNAVPVVGVYGFGWQAGLVVFNIWFDGLVALAATIAMLVPRALRETMPPPEGLLDRLNGAVAAVFLWGFLVAMAGLPYWVVLIPLHPLMLASDVLDPLRQSPALWLTFGAIAVQHAWQAYRIGYGSLSEPELKQKLRWNVYLLILRAVAMFMLAQFVFALVPLLALLLCYLEIWPERALGAVFGNPTRLHAHDSADD